MVNAAFDDLTKKLNLGEKNFFQMPSLLQQM